MFNYEIITAFSRELFLKDLCWIMDYHITSTPPKWMTNVGLKNHHNTWIPAGWKAHVGLWIHRNIPMKAHPEWVMLHYGIVRAFSGKPLLKSSCWTTESSKHCLENFPWIAHVELLNHDSIIVWTPLEWFTLDYGIITVFSCKILLHQSCCTIESSKHSHVNSSWIANVGKRIHQNIVTWTPPEWIAHVGLYNNPSIQ